MFEHRKQPLVSSRHFINRTLRFAGFASCLLFFSLLIGMAGYHFFAEIGWTDAFYNASMILTGMGPALDIDGLPEARREAVKIFAGCYALYSGVIFLAASGLILSPILHRFFHHFHLEMRD